MAEVIAEGAVIPRIYDQADVSKQVVLSTAGMSPGTVSQLTWSGTSSSMTFPSGSSTVATTTLNQTITTKTFTSCVLDDASNTVRATKLATSGTPVTITLSLPVVNQALLTTSATAAAYTTLDWARILTIGAVSGGTNVQLTGGSQLILTTSSSIITSLQTVPVTIKAADSVSANTSGAGVNITGGNATGNGNGGSISISAGKVGTGTSGGITLDVDTNASGASSYSNIDLRGHLASVYPGLPTVSRVSGAGAISISPDSNDTSGNVGVGSNTVVRVTFSRPYQGNVRVFWSITTDTGAGALSDKFGVIADTPSRFDFTNTSARNIAFNYLVIQR